jgi:hypothetical protein
MKANRTWGACGGIILPLLLAGCSDPQFHGALNDFVNTASVIVGGAGMAVGVSQGNTAMAGQGGNLMGQGLQGFAGAGSTAGGDASGAGVSGDQSSPGATCPGYPETRQGISECYRAIARQMEGDEQTCRARQANLSGSSNFASGTVISNGQWGQADSFEDCADLNNRGKLYATCIADGILDPQNQYYPLQSACAQRYGFQ